MSSQTEPDMPSLRKTHRGIISIISMGDMGAGIARLLTAHNYAVLTNVSDRSEDTKSRAVSAGALLVSDDSLLLEADLILSIVPPAEALGTAKRIISASSSLQQEKTLPVYVDLNAVSPKTSKLIAEMFAGSGIEYLDGAILGHPPSFSIDNDSWTVPLLPISGLVESFLLEFKEVFALLNTKYLGEEVGKASSLKMVFATLSKGYAAIALQSVVTASRLGVLEELKSSVKEVQGEGEVRRLERIVTCLPPKAGRWVREMEEIGDTHEIEGGWLKDAGIFRGAAEVFRIVAEDTELGREKVDKRKRGLTVEDVGLVVGEGLERKGEDERKKG
ncbi:6-phosphogluconate dehydrogenase [Podospora fimiseda]|uniref:6-phosphogluconate dehydrogenase n=1 Tax=Podospora fimiseda TaxID=252190 RepID=A0AAN7H0Q9_9PEZI|nr:6-phosphogluconate dehydrogenase [Podospora fimiseda]